MEVIAPATCRPYVTLQSTVETSPMDVEEAEIMRLFKEHGALLLRGFGVEIESLSAFTDQFCSGSVFNESPDRLLLDADHNIQSVNSGTSAFPLHPELSREPWKPDVCFFACLIPPRALGATTICDGVELVRQLPDAVRKGFEGRRLRYVQAASPEIFQFWLGTTAPTDAERATPPPHCPYDFDRYGDHDVRIFSRPALHRPMFTESLAFGNFLLFSFYFNRMRGFPSFDDGQFVPDEWLEIVKSTGESLTAAIEWQEGDLLMLDNSRFMHGRTAVIENDNRMIASYFGYLKDAPVNPEEPVDPPWRSSTFCPPSRRIAQ